MYAVVLLLIVLPVMFFVAVAYLLYFGFLALYLVVSIAWDACFNRQPKTRQAKPLDKKSSSLFD